MNIRIYGRPNCQWCDAAKNLCDIKGLTYEYFNLYEMKEVDARNVVAWSGMKSVPIIYVDNELVGGFDAFEGWLKGKKL